MGDIGVELKTASDQSEREWFGLRRLGYHGNVLLEVGRLFEGVHDFQHVVSERPAAAVVALSAFIKDRIGHIGGSDAAAVLATQMAQSLIAPLAGSRCPNLQRSAEGIRIRHLQRAFAAIKLDRAVSVAVHIE